MMTRDERDVAIARMKAASSAFYGMAVSIGNHPFIEFTGLLNEYIKIAERAHKNGIDFSQCNAHSGAPLPMKEFEIEYFNGKLECIFGGRIMVKQLNCASAQGKGEA